VEAGARVVQPTTDIGRFGTIAQIQPDEPKGGAMQRLQVHTERSHSP
jgi:hypothetical protein